MESSQGDLLYTTVEQYEIYKSTTLRNEKLNKQTKFKSQVTQKCLYNPKSATLLVTYIPATSKKLNL